MNEEYKQNRERKKDSYAPRMKKTYHASIEICMVKSTFDNKSNPFQSTFGKACLFFSLAHFLSQSIDIMPILAAANKLPWSVKQIDAYESIQLFPFIQIPHKKPMIILPPTHTDTHNVINWNWNLKKPKWNGMKTQIELNHFDLQTNKPNKRWNISPLSLHGIFCMCQIAFISSDEAISELNRMQLLIQLSNCSAVVAMNILSIWTKKKIGDNSLVI